MPSSQLRLWAVHRRVRRRFKTGHCYAESTSEPRLGFAPQPWCHISLFQPWISSRYCTRLATSIAVVSEPRRIVPCRSSAVKPPCLQYWHSHPQVTVEIALSLSTRVASYKVPPPSHDEPVAPRAAFVAASAASRHCAPRPCNSPYSTSLSAPKSSGFLRPLSTSALPRRDASKLATAALSRSYQAV